MDSLTITKLPIGSERIILYFFLICPLNYSVKIHLFQGWSFSSIAHSLRGKNLCCFFFSLWLCSYYFFSCWISIFLLVCLPGLHGERWLFETIFTPESPPVSVPLQPSFYTWPFIVGRDSAFAGTEFIFAEYILRAATKNGKWWKQRSNHRK